MSLLLMSTGVVTAVPLLLFGAAATRIPLTWVGLLQYVAPVLQFVIGVAVYDEPMPASRWIGFCLVWIALLILAIDSAVGRPSRRDCRRTSSSRKAPQRLTDRRAVRQSWPIARVCGQPAREITASQSDSSAAFAGPVR